MTKWIDKGIIRGDSKQSYKPDHPMTRAELASFIVRILNLKETSNKPFADVPSNAWYASDFSKAFAAGLILGDASGHARPLDFISREEAAVIYSRVFQLQASDKAPSLKFADAALIADWSRQAVQAMQEKGYIKGKIGNKFDPKGRLTRAEAFQIFDNVVDEIINDGGTYSGDYQKSIIINGNHVVLTNMTIKGDLYLTVGVDAGVVTLDGVEVEGNIIINGGGPEGVIISNSQIKGKVVVNKEQTKVVADNSVIHALDLVKPANISLNNSKVDEMVLGNKGTGSELHLDKQSTVGQFIAQAPITITGANGIDNADIQAGGVVMDNQPGKIIIAPGISAKIAGKDLTAQDLTNPSGSTAPGGGSSNPTNPIDPTEPIDPMLSQQLIEKDSPQQRRWMSVPQSRIVVNPFDFHLPDPTTQVHYSNSPILPLNIGFLSPWPTNYKGYTLDKVMGIFDKSNTDQTVENVWSASFNDPDKWRISEFEYPEDAIVDFNPNYMQLSVKNDATYPWQFLTSESIAIDLDKNPLLQLHTETTGSWAIKIYDLSKGDRGDERVLRAEGSGDGTETVDIAKMVPDWTGKKDVLLRIFQVGKGSYLKINTLDIVEIQSTLAEASDYTTTWAPHELTFGADYNSGLQLEGADFFYDENTVVRTIKAKQNGTSHFISLFGQYKGDIQWDEGINTLYVSTGTTLQDQQYAISFGQQPSGGIRYFESYADMLIDNGSSQPHGKGYWLMDFELDALPPGGLSAAFSIGTPADSKVSMIESVRNPFENNDRDRKFKERLDNWNQYLAKVPKPGKFELEHVEPQGVTFEQIEQEYYKAWVFTASNILAAAPEVGFNYPQIVTGKASLWGHGDQKAAYSASWESLLSIQQYAYIDVDLAWDAFKGMMSLVDDDGLMAGESLPSRKAQTALILYNISKDADSLEEIYPALERYLLWRIDHLRWIMPGVDDPAVIDAEFAVSALKDIEFAMEISRILGYTDKIDFWEDRYKELYKKYTTTFWKDGVPYQYYNVVNGEFTPGNPLWTSTGMYITDLDPTLRESLYNRLKANMNPEAPFAGLFIPKHPDVGYLTYGLIENGFIEDAKMIIETMIRDVTKAHFFAEQYSVPGVPYPQGVRPSSFGATMLVDNVLQRNGYRMDMGKPMFTNLFEADGEVSNILLDGSTLNYKLDASKKQINLSGSWMGGTSAIIDAPDHKPVHLPAIAESPLKDQIIGVGEQVRLQLQDAVTYYVASSKNTTAAVERVDNVLTVTGLSAGNAVITVVSSRNGYSDTIRTFDVGVSAITGWQHEQAGLDAWTWDREKLNVNEAGGKLQLDVLQDNYIETVIEADSGTIQLLKLAVTEASARWGISLINESNEEVVVREIGQGTGDYLYDLEALTGWTGQQTFKLRIYASQLGGRVIFNTLKLMSKPEITMQTIADYEVEAYTDTTIPLRTTPGLVNYELTSEHPEIANAQMAGNQLKLQALSEGTTTITILLQRAFYGDRSLSFHVNVSIPDVAVADIAPQYVSVDASKRVQVVAVPDDVTIVPVSSDSAIVQATVQDGELSITGVSEGNATISLTLSKTGYQSATKTFSVTVFAKGLGWQADFTDLQRWNAGYSSNPGGLDVVQLDGGASGVKLTMTDQASPTWQPFYTKIKVNVDETPILQIRASDAAKNWTVKIGTSEFGDEQALKGEDGSEDTFNFNLKAYGPMSGWTGEQEFFVKVYVVGGSGASITIDQLRMVSQSYLDNIASAITVDDIAPQYVSVDASKRVQVAAVPGDVTIAPVSSDSAIVQATVQNGQLLISGISEGEANVTLTLSKAGYHSLTMTFPVTVLAEGLGWQADFTDLQQWEYGYPLNPGGIKVEQVNGGADGIRLTTTDLANPAWQHFYTKVKVKVNVDETPILQIRTSAAKDNWTIKIENTSLAIDQALKEENGLVGTLNYNLTNYGPMLGWTGEQEFIIKIFVIGEPGASITINQLRIVSQSFIDGNV
ncbi:S-layer homology domain-containing protein [Paenibacillus sp. PAMC21692]|nr:S-layer homology domain-containing protein [Paenibacillus sp. PAMC21692]